jgi:anthranilate synthase component 1
MSVQTRESFVRFVADQRTAHPGRTLVVPLCVRLLSDQLTPVLAYRRLVAPDARTAPSFLLESVEGGERQGRYSLLGARPIIEVIAREHRVRVTDATTGQTWETAEGNPLDVPRRLTASMVLCPMPSAGRPELPTCVLGGWFGFAGYDTVRYAEPEKLAFSRAPRDDRGLPDLHFAFYDGVIAFDHVDKLAYIVQMAMVKDGEDAAHAFDRAWAKLEGRVAEVQQHSKPLPAGRVGPATAPTRASSNMTRQEHAAMLARAMEYIRAGDIFQVVLGQRFERHSGADPFDVYRALRVVNPSPYMVYMQGQGCILVASSPEILCRVRREADGSYTLTNRPLAGTRKRGTTPAEDRALEAELLADAKERAEHIMLVDLGRNDVGRVCVPGSIKLPTIMEVERYSHVMHISSTVTGTLRPGLDCWDALAATLPVGTISGAPKIRAMQIIDELEPIRRGPYGGGMGYIGLDGQMDIALALRTMVVPTDPPFCTPGEDGTSWTYHLQAAGGIVADSQAEPEYMETVNKSAALGRAIDLAEQAFAT